MSVSSESTSTAGQPDPAGVTERAVVLVPGREYDTNCPLLYFAREAADVREAYVEAIRWTPPDLDQIALREWLHGPAEAWACGQVFDALTRVDKQVPGARTVLIGKSLGSRAAPVAADRDVPAVWFTPLLRTPSTVAALRRCTAPFLLVGGTADESWDGELARELTPHVLELPDADHGLVVPGPLAGTIGAHAAALTAVETFLDQVAWA
ncbi:MAG: alpha/beta hydrolase [Actinocatenispora sp.]